MKVLFIYPNFGGYGKIPVGMSLLMTILKNEGHKVDLFDVSFIIEDHNFQDEIMEGLGSKETNTTHLYDYHTFEEIDDLLISRLKTFSPDPLFLIVRVLSILYFLFWFSAIFTPHCVLLSLNPPGA